MLLATDGNILFQEKTSNRLWRPHPSCIGIHDKNFYSKVSNSHLAAVSHMSESYFFMNGFKKAAGIGAIEYLNQL